MKAITLTQPWATLMALQEKRVETRSWKLPDSLIGQQVAIHAAKGFPKWAKETCEEEPFRSSLRVAYPELSIGKILCFVRFQGCRFTQDVRDQLSEKERAFGDYGDGRYTWFSEFIMKLTDPIPATGHLGFWEI